MSVGQESPKCEPDDSERALDNQDRQRRGGDPPAEGSREGDRGETVEYGFQCKLVDAAPEAVGERTEDGERSYTEDQRRGDEPLDEPLLAAGRPGSRERSSLRGGLGMRAGAGCCDTRPAMATCLCPRIPAGRQRIFEACAGVGGRAWRESALQRPPMPSRRSSMRRSEPAIPPSSSEPSTISTGARAPTARPSELSSTLAADSAATSSVTRPSASVTTSRVRSGSRCPRSTPMLEPTRTVATLSAVPAPRIALLG